MEVRQQPKDGCGRGHREEEHGEEVELPAHEHLVDEDHPEDRNDEARDEETEPGQRNEEDRVT